MSKKLNTNLHQAKRNKKDEFYTQLIDIENELKHYKDRFKDKVVYCNCDDPYKSNFVKYFIDNFEELNLKKLIASCYKDNTTDLFDPKKLEPSYFLEYEGGGSLKPEKLMGDGDFRSQECIELLKKADIVVTNPPFSLFREYVAQLVEYKKKFLIIGNKNAITYKEIFKLIKENKMWIGSTPMSKDIFFDVPEEEAENLIENKKSGSAYRIISGVVKARAQAIWFTNLDHNKQHEDLILHKNYNPKDYAKYENYEAIEVSKTKEIPIDYKGIMGVPITFLDKYNPDQFEILGKTTDKEHACKYLKGSCSTPMLEGKYLYDRILIKNKRL